MYRPLPLVLHAKVHPILALFVYVYQLLEPFTRFGLTRILTEFFHFREIFQPWAKNVFRESGQWKRAGTNKIYRKSLRVFTSYT